MKIGEFGERAIIKEIAQMLQKGSDSDYVGIGDDAALTQPSEGMWLTTSKDMLVEGVHFLLHAITAHDLGYKSLAVNISDIAAMGALPRHAYVALALPKETKVDYIREFYRGALEAADRYNMAISGGDTVGSPGPLVVSVTVQGEVKREQALLRSGASPGDVLCTTGALGASAAGLALLLQEIHCSDDVRKAALLAHNRPQPRVEAGAYLAESGAATAAMDLSDGLLKDLSEICEASNCGALLYEEYLPIHPAASAVAEGMDKPPLEFVLNGGEDYELLFTLDALQAPVVIENYHNRFGTQVHRIGEMCRELGIWMITKDGKREQLQFKGFKHF
jgi:thiamine-monophosphate kinase